MKKTIIISTIFSLLFFVLGYLAGSTGLGLNQLAKSDNNFQAGWEAAKKRLSDANFFPNMDKAEINSIAGAVKAINGNNIILTIRPLEPLADPALDERDITVDSDTKIYILEQKDSAVYRQEIEDFQKKMQAQADDPASLTPPESFIKKLGSLADIKVGATLNITAQDKDIKNIKSFKAAEISF